MRKIPIGLAAAAILAFGGAGPPSERPGPPPRAPVGGWHVFDPARVEAVAGRIVSLDLSEGPEGYGAGVHLLLRTGSETLEVHLCPAWFLAKRGFDLRPGRDLQVTGARVEFEGRSALVASELRLDGRALLLRDALGRPLWGAR